MLKRVFIPTALAAALLASPLANATVVQFQTVLGPFEVNLYDQRTPATVANFLEHVDARAYDNVVIHRLVPDFIIQGGGFASEGTMPLVDVPENSPVVNEPEFSNVIGTIAMAKIPGDPDSATNQWFFNLADNSANLDLQNGGFTVFGEITGAGMDVVNAINALPVFNFGGALESVPLQNYTAQNAADLVPVTDAHLIRVTAIVVLDGAVDTAAGLTPVENTLIDSPPEQPPVADGGGGGGATGPMSLLLLGLLYMIRRRVRAEV